MLLKLSLAAIVLVVNASSPDDEKNPSPEVIYRSLPLPALPASIPSSREILIPSRNFNPTAENEEIMFPPPAGAQSHRIRQRFQNLESGSSSFRNSGGIDSFLNNSPLNEGIGFASYLARPSGYYSSAGNSKTSSFVPSNPAYNDSYSYHAIAISHGQMSSGDITAAEEPVTKEVARQKTKNKKSNYKVKVKNGDVEMTQKDEPAPATASDSKKVDLFRSGSKRIENSPVSMPSALDRKKVEDQSSAFTPTDRRKVTAELFKNPDLNPFTFLTPSRKGSTREGKGEKRDSYFSALTEALMLKPDNPPSIELPPPVSTDESIPFDEWSLMFRLPSSMVGGQKWGSFKFSRCMETDAVFAKQLDEFRTSIMAKQGKKLELPWAMDYVPFPIEGVPLEKQPPNRPVSVKPIKIFEAQPTITWNYVECSVLGMEFELVRERKGRELKSGRKCSIQYVKYGGRMFVRKVYNSLEYFLNELKLLQHAHHEFLPNPICIEKSYLAIVMERVEGPRFHDAMYMTMTNKYHAIKEQLKDHEDTKAVKEYALKTAWTETWDVMVILVAKLMTVIQYIHSLGFVHCDIKPENVIYELGPGRIVLIDFDLSSTAPYLYSSRGTFSTIAPEVVGLLKGPVHFAADWWGFGSTVAIVGAFTFAGFFNCQKDYETAKKLTKYIPFVYNHTDMTYTMTPIPDVFPEVMREFLYPFFSPVPAHRNFSEPSAFEWISSHPFFNPVEDMKKYSVVTVMPSMVMGFMKFSQNPAVLVKMPRRRKTDTAQNMETLNRFILHYKRQEEEGDDEGNDEVDQEDSHESGVFAIEVESEGVRSGSEIITNTESN